MLYRFKSRATADVLMLGPQGDTLLRVLGREPCARGILTPEQMPQALQAIEAAIAADEQARAERAERTACDARGIAAHAPGAEEDDKGARGDALPLKRRLWPVVEMIRRALADNEPVVWGA